MVYFPVRKCYQAVKIAMLVILVVTVIALFEQWRGGKRNTEATYTDSPEAEYEKQILEDEARIIPGLGEGGVAAHLMGEEKKLGEESEKKLAINVYLSDRISYNRTLKDYRNPACQRVVYDAELPSASVIIIFHNEPYSVIVRTLWSVVNSARRSNPWYKHANFVDQQTGRVTNMGYPGQDPNSPYVYVKEIILVDDNSTLPELKGKLSHYIRTRLPPDLIRVLRLPDRIGLTRARLAGARFAAGDVLVFLDSHCEAQRDWLRPLLSAIKQRPHAVVLPIIDVIETSTFYYSVGDISTFQVGGFTFMGHFTWTEVPEREKKRRGSDIAPTWSPTMAGGLFAISRDYFWELGAYDEQMAGWGGENLEMSFRIWQCGGTLETIPCSRVGHVFRAFHPYGLPASSDTHGINTARMAEVWMDEYAELFYMHRPDLRNNPRIGDITHRRVLRDKLKCKSFQWYLDNIYKEKYVPVRDVYGYGRFKNEATHMCLDTLQREGDKVALGAYPCYPALQATQYFSLSNKGEIRDEANCASVPHTRANTDDGVLKRPVLMSTCHGKGRDQKWQRLPTGQLRHESTALCLTAPRTVADVTATLCDPDSVLQIWKIDYNEDNDFKLASDGEPMSEEREGRISRLRGQRSNRISRSLLSYPDNVLENTDFINNATVRRHTHKSKHHKRHGHKAKHSSHSAKRRVKNKFILKIVRTLMNGTDEHLEVDIHCKHKQLYPNNTFVRDLVTILNDKNIKVINNGRVFERNKVSELNAAQTDKVLNKLGIEGLVQDPAPPSHTLLASNLPQVFPPVGKTHKKTKITPEVQSVANHKPVARPKGSGFVDIEDVPSLSSNHLIGREREGDIGKDKKLIIEDFVEINNEHTTEDDKLFAQRYKHKRRPHAPTLRPIARHAHAALRKPIIKDSSEPMKTDSDSDVMDSPLMDDNIDRGEAKEDWSIGESRFRHDRNYAPRSGEHAPQYPPVVGDLLGDMPEMQASARNSNGDHRGHRPRAHLDMRHERRHDTGLEHAPVDTDVRYNKDELTAFSPRYRSIKENRTSVESDYDLTDKARRNEDADQGAPVKLVMRSNLTFNLGDELFSWRSKATEDIVNEFINELSIPVNYNNTETGDNGPIYSGQYRGDFGAHYAEGGKPVTQTVPSDSDSDSDSRTTTSRQRRTRTQRGDTNDHSSGSSGSSEE